MRRILCSLLLPLGWGACGGELALPKTTSAIQRVVVIIQENHTFDTHFGRYCTAPAGSNPACDTGPACCEAAPDKDPGTGTGPTMLDDAAHAAYDPNHNQDCERDEINGGKMDQFISSKVCGDARNFALSAPALVMPYWQLAASGALADRFFQPMIGASSGNDMYFARARYVFTDNQVAPKALGTKCQLLPMRQEEYTDKTLGDLLLTAQVPWAFYIEGYQAMQSALADGVCPEAPDACGLGIRSYPCVYDPTDIPFQYYASLRDNPQVMRDYARFAADLDAGQLPAVSFVKALGYKSEHSGVRITLSDGVAFATDVVRRVQASRAGADTLILLTYDEGGGYFDHVTPPATSTVDNQAYGTRVPTVAIGRFAKQGRVSHTVMEHSSIVKFIEWNWLGGATGQLGGRDAVVNNLGSLLDPAATVAQVPQ